MLNNNSKFNYIISYYFKKKKMSKIFSLNGQGIARAA